MTGHIEDETTLERFGRGDGRTVADLPRVTITSNDARRLRAILATARDADPSVRRFLSQELDRAVVCQPDIMPPNVVTMNSRVFFRRHIGQPIESRTLVYDDFGAIPGATLSVLTPLGAALLGLRDGSHMPYVSREGVSYVAVVERVAYQPEGEGRLQRAPYRYWPKPAGDVAAGGDRTVVPLRPRPQPRPRPTLPGDDPGPDNAA